MPLDQAFAPSFYNHPHAEIGVNAGSANQPNIQTETLKTLQDLLQAVSSDRAAPNLQEHDDLTHMSWVLSFSEKKEVFIDFDKEETAFITLSTPIAKVPGNPLQVFEYILLYNNQFNSAGAVRMGIDEINGQIVIIETIPTHGLDEKLFTSTLSHFLDRGAAWAEMIAKVSQRKDEAVYSEDLVVFTA